MAAGYNPFVAFGTGFVGGINKDIAVAKAQQVQGDDEKRNLALKLNFDTEEYAAKKKIDSKAAQDAYDAAQSGKQEKNNNATVPMLQAAQGSAAAGDAASQNATDTANIAPATPPTTNTPSQNVASTLPQLNSASSMMQPQPAAQVPNQQPQGGMNSPQGGNVPLTGSMASSDTTQNLESPNTPANKAVQNPSTPVTPNDGDRIVHDPVLNKDMTSDEYDEVSRRQVQYQTGKDGKEPFAPQAARQMGFDEMQEKKQKLGEKAPVWDGSPRYQQMAQDLGVPLFNDKGFQRMSSDAQMKEYEKSETRMFGSPADKKQIDNIPEITSDLKTLYVLNNKLATGGWKAVPGATNMASALDISGYNALYDKIAKRNAILQRPAGLGRMSVAELSVDQSSFARLGTPNAANNYIILTKLALAQRKAEQLNYINGVMSVNGRYDGGNADQIWQSYEKANPVLTVNAADPTHPTINNYSTFKSWAYGDGSQKTSILQGTTNAGGITQNYNEPSQTNANVDKIAQKYGF